ncbi:MliC family protein [Aeromonas sp.]|uniref:MliC family protein n=1 Tax=Aeromonas sp. TaxID=647 RepID=UPI00258BCB74|nr:MliC family protein [Aeromonas sp.]MCX7126534.1 MliC family protein [Aeromonas sp.]
MNKTLLATLLFVPLLASAATPSFDCGKAAEAVETLICKDAKLPVAVINLSEGDKQQQVLAYEAPSASGARYEGQNLTFFTKGDEATLERYDQPTLTCMENPTKG